MHYIQVDLTAFNGTAHPDSGSCCGQENNMDAMKDDALVFHCSRATWLPPLLSPQKNKKQKCNCRRIFAAVINVYRLHLQIGFSVWRSGKENLAWVPEGLKSEGLTMAACKIMMGDLLLVLKADIRTAACRMSVRRLWVGKLN